MPARKKAKTFQIQAGGEVASASPDSSQVVPSAKTQELAQRADQGEPITLKQVLDAVRQSETAAEQILEAVRHSELTAEELLKAVRSRQVATSATDGMLGPNPFVGLTGRDIGDTVKLMLKRAVFEPGVTLRHLAGFAKEEVRVLKGDSPLAPDKEDRRFTDPTWSENPLYRRGLQTYLAVRKEMDQWIDDTSLEDKDAERARFVFSLLTEAIAPSNWPLNPAGIKRLLETGGTSAVRGIRNLIHDIRHNNRMPAMVDRNAFQLGKDLANTPGHVVYRNPVFELIQYTPRVEQVYSRPFMMVPPQINKFYFYDLSAKKSLIRYGLDNGLQMFSMSWRNPTAAQRDWNLDTYVQAVEQAIDVVLNITQAEDCNIQGGCAGGITTASLLAYLAARSQTKVNSMSLMVTMLDMSADNQFALFATEQSLESAKRHSAENGVLDGAEMAKVFAWMRPNDLIWNYWVNNYLLGNAPPAFDVLAWNADTTRLPAAFHANILDLYKTNALAFPGQWKVRGVPIDLMQMKNDVYWMAGRTDHITPWPACYRSTFLLGGRCEFVLSSGGHIQSMLSVPGNPKNSYLTNPQRPRDADDWLSGATEHPGSWWEHWRGWIQARSGDLKKAPTTLGNRAYPPMEKAPGTYVYE